MPLFKVPRPMPPMHWSHSEEYQVSLFSKKSPFSGLLSGAVDISYDSDDSSYVPREKEEEPNFFDFYSGPRVIPDRNRPDNVDFRKAFREAKAQEDLARANGYSISRNSSRIPFIGSALFRDAGDDLEEIKSGETKATNGTASGKAIGRDRGSSVSTMESTASGSSDCSSSSRAKSNQKAVSEQLSGRHYVFDRYDDPDPPHSPTYSTLVNDYEFLDPSEAFDMSRGGYSGRSSMWKKVKNCAPSISKRRA